MASKTVGEASSSGATAPGILDVRELLASMRPSLHAPVFVFGHIPAKSTTDSQNILGLLASVPVQMLFREDEGWTVIVERSVAENIQLQSVFPCKKITLNVQSSLDAVGFLAVIQTELKKLEIGVNPVSGFFHDHLFVPLGKEDAVMDALRRIAEEVKEETA